MNTGVEKVFYLLTEVMNASGMETQGGGLQNLTLIRLNKIKAKQMNKLLWGIHPL